MLINFLLLICLICGSNPQEFCSEVYSIDGIFNYNDTIFVLKRNESLITIYRYKSNSSLKRNNGFTVKTYFKIDFQQLSTGFCIDSTPVCNSNDQTFCDEMKKLENISLAMGSLFPFNRQAYKSYRFDTYLNEISEHENLPFNLKSKSEINSGSFWPIKSEEYPKKVFYRCSAYVKSRFEIVFIVFDGRNSSFWVYWTSLKNNNWNTNWKKERLNLEVVFVGLFEFNKGIYAIANKRVGEDITQVLYEYTGNAAFVEKKSIDTRKTIFGCDDKQTTGTTSTSSNTSTKTTNDTKNTKFTITTTVTTRAITKRLTDESRVWKKIVIIIVQLIVIIILVLIGFYIMYGIPKSKSKISTDSKTPAKTTR